VHHVVQPKRLQEKYLQLCFDYLREKVNEDIFQSPNMRDFSIFFPSGKMFSL